MEVEWDTQKIKMEQAEIESQIFSAITSHGQWAAPTQRNLTKQVEAHEIQAVSCSRQVPYCTTAVWQWLASGILAKSFTPNIGIVTKVSFWSV